jgi:hypothetical protein
MKKVCALALLIAFALPVLAGLAPKQVAQFVESQEDLDSDGDPRAQLYRALKNAPANAPFPAAVSTLSKQWNISAAAARAVIEGVVLGVEASEPAEIEKVDALFRAAIKAAPDSRGVWNAAVAFLMEQGRCGDTTLRDTYLSKPFVNDPDFFPLCESWIPTYAGQHPQNLLVRAYLPDYYEQRDLAAALAASRWMLDAFPKRGAERASDVELHAIRRLWKFLDLGGLGDELLSDAAARSPAEREALLRVAPGNDVKLHGEPLVAKSEALDAFGDARRAWLLALVLAGRGGEARAFYDAKLEGEDLMRDLVVGVGKDVDLFERYVGDGEKGLLWFDAVNGVQSMLATAKFLDASRFSSAARMLEAHACSGMHEHLDEEERRQLNAMPPPFSEYLAHYTQLLAERNARTKCPPLTAGAEMSARLPRFPEIPMSAAQKARRELPGLTLEIPLPESFSLVRAEKAGDRILAVCLSSAVDPGGEVSRGGYWLLRSMDGGHTWLDPLYLGFQDHGQYVVREKARVSMFIDKAVRLEVDVEELDPRSITFPPVGLSLRREAHDVYIDIPLADLEKDSDGDGFPDLLETKLQTDPARADSDGDGIGDRFDDFPQVSARAEPHALAPIVVDVLKRVAGYEHAGIIEPVRKGSESLDILLRDRSRTSTGSMLFMFIEGDASLFAGLRTQEQTIVVDAAQIADLQARFGPFYPLSFPAILVDASGTRAFVQWSAGWAGGSLMYTRTKEGVWEGKELGSWITRVPRPAPAESPG